MKRWIVFFITLFFSQSLLSDPLLAAAKLKMLEIKQRQDQTILILTLQNAVQPNFFMLNNPERLVLDLPNTRASSALPKDIHSNGLIQRIRLGAGPKGPGNLRLVTDLAAPMQYIYLMDQEEKTATETITIILRKQGGEAAVLPKQKETKLPYEEPLDLEELERQSQPSKSREISQSIAPLSMGQADLLQPAQQKYASIKQSPLKKVIIMLDPGHGGKDSGAIGPNKTMEKMVVLSISKKLQNLLNQEPGIDARMTRKGDYFISLRQRLNIARKNRAQLFVAIHADAFNNDTASGASVFALSEHGATSEAARWLAERENTSELSGIDLKIKDRELKSVLLDMSQTATIDDSLQLGHSMLVALAKLTRLHTNRVEQAGFVVLKSPDIPSVLVETGFISNPSEEKLLVASPYQDRIARALEQGIASYFKQNPPPDSWFEMQFKNTQ